MRGSSNKFRFRRNQRLEDTSETWATRNNTIMDASQLDEIEEESEDEGKQIEFSNKKDEEEEK